MSCIQQMDELVKEYLLFRGFTTTVRALDAEVKSEKDKAFRVRVKLKTILYKLLLTILSRNIYFWIFQPDKIVEQFIHFITLYDLNGLKDYWNHFDQSVFERLDPNFMPGFY